MMKEPSAVFPLPSVAVQCTVVVPTGNTYPDAGRQATDTTPELSVAVAANTTVAPAELVAFVSMLPGTLSTGGVVSAAAGSKRANGGDNAGISAQIWSGEAETVRLTQLGDSKSKSCTRAGFMNEMSLGSMQIVTGPEYVAVVRTSKYVAGLPCLNPGGGGGP